MIIVMPDERTKMMGSFYTNSAATGNWEDFTEKDLVNFIDGKYRTIAKAESRGIAGHSMGGYGAIKLGMKHPAVFSVVYAMNPAILGCGTDVSIENPAFAELFKMKTLEQAFQGGRYAIGALCLAQAFSPNPNNLGRAIVAGYCGLDGGRQKSRETTFATRITNSRLQTGLTN